jgi:hypothetical protein
MLNFYLSKKHNLLYFSQRKKENEICGEGNLQRFLSCESRGRYVASSPLIRHAPPPFQPPQMESLLHTIYPSNGISAPSSLHALGKEEKIQGKSNLQVADFSQRFLFDLETFSYL